MDRGRVSMTGFLIEGGGGSLKNIYNLIAKKLWQALLRYL